MDNPTLTLTQEQLDLMLAMARDVGWSRERLARAEQLHSVSTFKRRTYESVRVARKELARVEQALEGMRKRVGCVS